MKETTEKINVLKQAGLPLYKISELIGKPELKPETELTDETLSTELRKIISLMKKNKLSIDFIGTYSKRLQYKFITEEFMEKKIAPPAQCGSPMGFIYEEFYPDHKLWLKQRSVKFIQALFGRESGILLWELDDKPILPGGKGLLASRIHHFIDSYRDFKTYKYKFRRITFHLTETGGSGYTEGFVTFRACNALNVTVGHQGPFKFWFTLDQGWWSVRYFIFPGIETDTEFQEPEYGISEF